MKKLFVVMAAASTVAFAAPALADIDEGRITAIKPWSVALDRTHQFYTVRDPAMLKELKAGDRVRVEFAQVEGEQELVKIERMPNQ